MIDEHLIPNSNWGISPILFNIGSVAVPSYSFFIGLALLAGLLIYWLEAKKSKQLGENTFYIVLAALIGGVIGAKIIILIAYWDKISLSLLITGKSIIGALIGGTIGVIITKKILKIQNQRKGNLFAPAIALGVAIGRIGCFLRGCCFGKPTNLPWGFDFGDGILRHPTQLYESIFMFGMFLVLLWKKKRNPAPGSLFRFLMLSYFSFRFLIEFIREEPIAFLGLTYFQIISLGVLVYYFFIDNRINKQKY